MPRGSREQTITQRFPMGDPETGGISGPPRRRAMVGGSSISRKSLVQVYKERLEKHNNIVNAHNSEVQKFKDKYSKYIKEKNGEKIFQVPAKDPLVSQQLTKQKYAEYKRELTKLERREKDIKRQEDNLNQQLSGLKSDKFAASVLEQERQQAITAKAIKTVERYGISLGGRPGRAASTFILSGATGAASETIGATQRVGISPQRQVVGRPVESAFAALNVGLPLSQEIRGARQLRALKRGGIGAVGSIERTQVKGIGKVFGKVKTPGKTMDFGSIGATRQVGRVGLSATGTAVRSGRGFRTGRSLSISLDKSFIAKTKTTRSTLEAGRVGRIDNQIVIGGKIKTPKRLGRPESKIPFAARFSEIGGTRDPSTVSGLKTIKRVGGKQKRQVISVSEQIAESVIPKSPKIIPTTGNIKITQPRRESKQTQKISLKQGIVPTQKIKTTTTSRVSQKQLTSGIQAIKLDSGAKLGVSSGITTSIKPIQKQKIGLRSKPSTKLKPAAMGAFPGLPKITAVPMSFKPPAYISKKKPSKQQPRKKTTKKKRKAVYRPSLVGLQLSPIKMKAPKLFTGLETRRRR